jgi:hypothetical protein
LSRRTHSSSGSSIDKWVKVSVLNSVYQKDFPAMSEMVSIYLRSRGVLDTLASFGMHTKTHGRNKINMLLLCGPNEKKTPEQRGMFTKDIIATADEVVLDESRCVAFLTRL